MKSHWTPRYVYHRLLDYCDQRSHSKEPWLNPKIREALDSLLMPTDAMVECGSGRSTLWFARRVQTLLSLEYDRAWFSRVQEDLRTKGVTNVDFRFVNYSIDGEQQQNDYIVALESLTDQTIDVALVDGGPRSFCTMTLIPKLRPGGLLILDDVHNFLPSQSESPNAFRNPANIPVKSINGAALNWRDVFQQIQSWRRLWLSNGVRDTAVFFKPCA